MEQPSDQHHPCHLGREVGNGYAVVPPRNRDQRRRPLQRHLGHRRAALHLQRLAEGKRHRRPRRRRRQRRLDPKQRHHADRHLDPLQPQLHPDGKQHQRLRLDLPGRHDRRLFSFDGAQVEATPTRPLTSIPATETPPTAPPAACNNLPRASPAKQGWFAARTRAEWSSSAAPRRRWEADSIQDPERWRHRQLQPGTTVVNWDETAHPGRLRSPSVASTIATGHDVTAGDAWTSTTINLSINGSAFAIVTSTAAPRPSRQSLTLAAKQPRHRPVRSPSTAKSSGPPAAPEPSATPTPPPSTATATPTPRSPGISFGTPDSAWARKQPRLTKQHHQLHNHQHLRRRRPALHRSRPRRQELQLLLRQPRQPPRHPIPQRHRRHQHLQLDRHQPRRLDARHPQRPRNPHRHDSHRTNRCSPDRQLHLHLRPRRQESHRTTDRAKLANNHLHLRRRRPAAHLRHRRRYLRSLLLRRRQQPPPSHRQLRHRLRHRHLHLQPGQRQQPRRRPTHLSVGTTLYQYNDDGQLDCRGTTVTSCPTGSDSFSWDGWNHTTSATVAGKSVCYSYDPAGNLLTRTYDSTGTSNCTTATSTTNYLLGDLFETNAAGTITNQLPRGPAGNLATLQRPAHQRLNRHLPLLLRPRRPRRRSQQPPAPAPPPTPTTPSAPHSTPHPPTPPATATPANGTNNTTAPTDLILMGARPYDPTLGRFLATDPMTRLTQQLRLRRPRPNQRIRPEWAKTRWARRYDVAEGA